jgi:hypothetical protein
MIYLFCFDMHMLISTILMIYFLEAEIILGMSY